MTHPVYLAVRSSADPPCLPICSSAVLSEIIEVTVREGCYRWVESLEIAVVRQPDGDSGA